MILRGSILAEDKLALRSLAEEKPRVVPTSPQPAAPRERIPEMVQAATPVSVEPPRAVLTVEVVLAWLAVQDEVSREQCAICLSDEIESVRDKAHAEGLAAGWRDGEAKAREQVAATCAILESLVNDAGLRFSAEAEALATGCTDVVTEVLSKIAGPLLASRAAVVGAVAEVLKRVKEGRDLTIRVHASDVEAITMARGELATALQGRAFTIVADPRVEAGGCMVESQFGTLDGRFETQLHELARALREAKQEGGQE